MPTTTATKTKTKAARPKEARPVRSSLLEVMDQIIEAEKRQRVAGQRPTKGPAKVEPEVVCELEPDTLAEVLAEPVPAGAEAPQSDQETAQDQPVEPQLTQTSASPSFTSGAVVWEAPCRRRIDVGQPENPADPDDRYALPIVLSLAARLVAGERDYKLELLENGSWNQIFSAYSPDGAAVGIAFWQLDILADDLAKLSALPRLRPAEALRRQREADYLASMCIGGHNRS